MRQATISVDECLQLIPNLASRRGKDITESMLRAALPYRVRGTAGLSATQLRNMLGLLGLQTRPWRGAARQLAARDFPCLCLTQTGLRLVEAAAPVQGLFLLSVQATPTQAAVQILARQGWSRQLLGKYRRVWINLLAMSFAVQLVALAVPLLTMIVYDRVAGAAVMTDLLPLGIGLALVAVGETFLRRVRLRLVSWVAARLDHLINTYVVERLLLLPAAMIEGVSIPAQLARLKSFEAIRDFLGSPLFLNLFELPAALLMLLIVYVISGPLALVPLLMVGLYLLVFLAIRPVVANRLETAGRAQAARQDLMLEILREPLTLRADGLAGFYATRGARLTQTAVEASCAATRLQDWIEHGAGWANGMAGVITLIWGVERVLAGELTQGALLATMLLTWRLLAPLAMFCTTLPRFEQMALAFRQLDQLQHIPCESDGRIRHLPTPRVTGQIEFANIALRHPRALTQNGTPSGMQGGEPILLGLNLTVQPGELIAIMGPNGTGKSTLLKLVPGLVRPQIGAVRIDGIDIRQFDVAALRQLVAYLPQQPDLFQGSIASNLRLARPDADEAAVWQALRSAGADDDVRALPQGLATRIGGHDRWTIPPTLAYRIGIARVLLRDAKLRLLDELPSTLLQGSANDIYRTLLLGSRGTRTTLFVTHRREHAELADRIVYLRGTQQGGHTAVVGPARDLQGLLAEMDR